MCFCGACRCTVVLLQHYLFIALFRVVYTIYSNISLYYLDGETCGCSSLDVPNLVLARFLILHRARRCSHSFPQ